MELSTPVILPKSDIAIGATSNVMLIGSCFAEHVGLRLQQRMDEGRVEVNPFGVLYNPVSIANALNVLMAADDDMATCHIFKGQDGIFHSWLHTSHFSGTTCDECKEKIVRRMKSARDFLRRTNVLCVTFGTTRCYKIEDVVVANCHKEPQRCFTEYDPSLDELKDLWTATIQKLRSVNPGIRLCFTVSPYRYRKYGFHQSQIQKAKLLLLTNELTGTSDNNSATDVQATACGKDVYFPAYEILLDELRDYRFYATDMLHPSDQAVDIITERFMEWTFTADMKALAKENLRRYKQQQHRKIL